jgi:hypothetical protein
MREADRDESLTSAELTWEGDERRGTSREQEMLKGESSRE